MKKGKLVVVSNRLPSIKHDTDWKAGQIASAGAGGLVTALLPVMEEWGRGVWMGWSGRSTESRNAGNLREVEHPLVRFLGMDLSEKELDQYYNGFCNRTLWPMFHCFQARVRVDRGEQQSYFKVNEKFSRRLLDFLSPDDVVWVNDYHMAPLGKYLRQGGFKGPIGYFLHIPFPPLEMIELLPDPHSFMEAWLAYDLVGFHTERYRDNYIEVMSHLLRARKENGHLASNGRRQRVISNPIGIQPRIFDPNNKTRKRNRKKIGGEHHDCKLIFGVDRLDYTKGIPDRIRAYEHLLKNFPRWRRQSCLVQVCSPSRTRVREYREQKEQVDSLVGRINGEYSEHNWLPIRYLYRTYDQADLAHFYREADVGLVTPLRDGMNLVALEFVAAQRPENPGALVLSRFTGAAEYFPDAVQVNPYLQDSVAEGIDRALSMPLAERQERHRSMMAFVTRNTSAKWAEKFISMLTASTNVREISRHETSGKIKTLGAGPGA